MLDIYDGTLLGLKVSCAIGFVVEEDCMGCNEGTMELEPIWNSGAVILYKEFPYESPQLSPFRHFIFVHLHALFLQVVQMPH